MPFAALAKTKWHQFFSVGVREAKAAKTNLSLQVNVVISSRYKLFSGFCP
ncbi:unnamed protein product [Rhodiola kirilowii]